LVFELQQHAKALTAPYKYPRSIEFIDTLPLTPTGKVRRRDLKLRERAAIEETA
jgi:acetyl-CoA synthetase